MREIQRIEIRVTPTFPGAVRSLVWRGEDLFDPIGGERVIRLAGEQSKPPYGPYPYPFDRAAICPGGCHVAMYTARQTKGLILGRERTYRQINRDYYHAGVYEYPIALGRIADGRELLAHCPDKYSQLEIESLDTGEPMTGRPPSTFDFFHSRLEFSPGGRYLLSAGWYWHPWDSLYVYDVEAVLAEPQGLDGKGDLPGRRVAAELASATFRDDDTLIVATVPDPERMDDPEPEPRSLGSMELASWSISSSEWLTRAPLEKPVGGLMSAGSSHVISFHEHPRLIDLNTGRVVREWSDLATGTQLGSYASGTKDVPPIAKDPAGLRFAVADSDLISVIRLER